MGSFFEFLEKSNEFIWGRIAFLMIVGLGSLLMLRSRFFPFRKGWGIFRVFLSFFRDKSTDAVGIHPLKAFFAAIGGCIGIGNIVGICTAVQIGGPGALFWTWIGGFCGMVIQYSEVFLGMRYRIKNGSGNYDGGPMYFLPVAYKGRWIAYLVSLLLCVYGVETFMFNVMTHSISSNWGVNPYIVAFVLLAATLVVALGGIKRVGEICSTLIPIFILIFLTMGFWVLASHFQALPSIFSEIFSAAFTPQAAKGGFAGSTVLLTISMGLSRGAYSGDIGVGYTSVIHSESSTVHHQRQASLAVVGIFLDTFVICTMSILVVLCTGVWSQGVDSSVMVQESLGRFFPYMHVFMPFFLFLLGFSTILAYFVVGVKCARFLSPKWGPKLYYAYAAVTLPLFAFVDTSKAFVVMSLSGAFLLIFNLFGIFLLRKEIVFGLDEPS